MAKNESQTSGYYSDHLFHFPPFFALFLFLPAAKPSGPRTVIVVVACDGGGGPVCQSTT